MPRASRGLLALGILPLGLLALGLSPSANAQADAQQSPAFALSLRLSQWRVASFPTSTVESASYRADSSLQNVTPRSLSYTGISLELTQAPKPAQWGIELFMDQTTRLGGTPSTFAALNALSGDRMGAGTGAELPFSVTGQLMRRRGVGAAHTFAPIATAWGDVRLRSGLRVFSVNQFRAIDAAGTLTESLTKSGNTQLQASAQDAHQGGTSLYVNPDRTSGSGVAFSAEATLGQPQGSHLMLAITDVGPPISMAHVLQTNRNINSNTLSYDANGYVQFAPVVNGKYTDATYKAKQYPSYAALGAYELSQSLQLLGRVQSSYPVTQYAGGAQWRTAAGGHQLQALLYFGPDLPISTALAWQHPSFSLQWRGDNLSIAKAKIWGLEGRLSF